MSPEEQQYITSLEREMELEKSKGTANQISMAGSSFATKDGNLIYYQLDTSEILNRIEHFLKGERIAVDSEGNEYWVEQKNPDLILFNEYGINTVMSIISTYVDKNTTLSIYHEERINEILADLGDELRRMIYCNYERMGMDTEYKKSQFGLVVWRILHSVESAYRKALRGETMKGINTSQILTQTDFLGRGNMPIMATKKRFNLFNPNTWVK